MNRNKSFSLVLILLLCGLAACETQVPIPVSDPDEVELDPEVVDLNEGSNGSAILNIQHGFEGPLGFAKIIESFTILIGRAPDEPRGETMIWGEAEGLVEFSMTGIGTEGSHTTTWEVPASYTVEGTFYPYPRCEFELQITEYLALSEVASLENTALGTIPTGPLGEDIVTFLPKITLSGPEYFDASNPSLVVSIETVVLDGDSGCMFSN